MVLQGYPKNSEDFHKLGQERKAQRDKFSIITRDDLQIMDETLCEISTIERLLCHRSLHTKVLAKSKCDERCNSLTWFCCCFPLASNES